MALWDRQHSDGSSVSKALDMYVLFTMKISIDLLTSPTGHGDQEHEVHH